MSLAKPQSAIQPLGFQQLNGAAVRVAASPDGTFWVLSTQGIPSGDKFIYHYVNGAFVNVPGAATRIAVGPDNTPWVLNAAGGIYHLVNGVFTGIAGGASELSVGGNTSAILIDVISNQAPGPYGAGIYQYNVNTATWTQLPGAGVTVAASIDSGTYGALNINPGGFYVTNQLGGIYYYNLGVGFEQLPGGAIQLAPTASGGLFALGDPGSTQHGIYYNDLSTGTWSQMPGAAVSISANSTSIYAIGAAGGIYVSPLTPSATPTPTPTATPTPGPGALVLSPSSLTFLGVGAAQAQTVQISQAGSTSAFSVDFADSTCEGSPVYAGISLNQTTATAVITPNLAGSCVFVFAGAGNQKATLNVSITTSSVVGQ